MNDARFSNSGMSENHVIQIELLKTKIKRGGLLKLKLQLINECPKATFSVE